MKKPHECNSIEEIRDEIDAIDKALINLMGKRLSFVKEIVRFKKNEEDIVAKKRYDHVLLERRKWAEDQGLDPNVIEQMYVMMIRYFIQVQKNTLEAKLKMNMNANSSKP